MTEIDFYLLSGDDLFSRAEFASKLCHKILPMDRHISIFTDDLSSSQRISEALWSCDAPGAFLAHIHSEQYANIESSGNISTCAIHLVYEEPSPDSHDVLINLSDSLPRHFSRFQRVIEVVNENQQTQDILRENYRFYQERGYALKTHNLRK